MKVGGSHLTYCTNIHPGETWPEVRANLERYVLAVKHLVCSEKPFGVGLRLSARAAEELAQPAELAALRSWLDGHGLYVFTVNGFPYGDFHGKPVKERVYRPDWLEPERIAYTNQLCDILAALLPDGVDGSISTLPGCFFERATAADRVASNLQRCAEYFANVAAKTGKHVTLALEPEPACMLETITDAIEFFHAFLPDRLHLGLCLDSCHTAIEFEDDLPRLFYELRSAEVPVAKVQLSSGLRVTPVDDAARAALAKFADSTYLHQVIARSGESFCDYVDLPDALADPTPADEWRVHFHVPIFREALGQFRSTQGYLAELIDEHRREPISPHLEVETYTWDVLPAEFRDQPLVDAIARELEWVLVWLRTTAER